MLVTKQDMCSESVMPTSQATSQARHVPVVKHSNRNEKKSEAKHM